MPTNLSFDEGALAVTLHASPMRETIGRRKGCQERYRATTHARFV